MSNIWFTGPIKSFNPLEWTLSGIPGQSQFGALTVMMVTTLCWWLFDYDRFKMLVTNHNVGDIFSYVGDFFDRWPTSVTCYQHENEINRSRLVKFRKIPQNRSCVIGSKLLISDFWNWKSHQQNNSVIKILTKIIRCKRILSYLHELILNSMSTAYTLTRTWR